MCRKLIYLVSLLMVFSLIAPVAAQDMEIPVATEPPVIDGEVDDIWANASAVQTIVPVDPASASGNWQALYDSENLYVIVDITDDSLVNDSASSWQDDSVEFYFDGGNTKDAPPLAGDNRQYTFGWTTDEIQGTNTQIDGVELAQVDTGTGWRIEIKFPWLSLQDAEPMAGDLIGIDCFYNDDDDGGDTREAQIWTFATDGSAWNDASQWGTAILADIPMPEPVKPGTDGLVAFYALDGDPNDSSGNGLNGTIVGDPNFVEGKVGMALDLDGVDDLVELGKIDVVGQITLAAWVRPDDFEINDARIITKAQEWGQDDHWWMLSTISETSLRFRLKTDEGASTAQLISGPVLEAGVFTHVAATWDGIMMRLYKDGVEIASQEKGGTAVAVDPDISAAIGSQPSDAFASDPGHVAKFFDGLIDDVRIYSRALSDGELLYLAGVRPVPVDPGADGLVAFYSLDGDPNDNSGNGLDGTIFGDPVFVEGKVGMALELDGIDDHVNLGNPAMLDFGTGDFTISAWINMTATERGTVYAKGGDNSGGIRYTLAMGESNDNKMTLTTDDDIDKRQARGDTVVNDGSWHHIVGIRKGSMSLVYVDGDQDGVIDLPEGYDLSGTSQANALIGAITDARDATGATLEKFFAGLIDEVAIYGRALSAGEIRYLAGFRSETLSGLADVTVVDGAIVSIRHEGTEYVVADGDLMLGTTTRWYVLDGVETLWAEGDPTAPQTVGGSSNPKDGDVGSKADNFNFTLDGGTNISSIDGIDFQETIFPSLTDTFFLFERGGNDVGTWQAIYADGSLGEPVAFVKASDGGPYADTGISVNGQNAYGVVFKTSVPVQGVRITASGHDTLSISAVAP